MYQLERFKLKRMLNIQEKNPTISETFPVALPKSSTTGSQNRLIAMSLTIGIIPQVLRPSKMRSTRNTPPHVNQSTLSIASNTRTALEGLYKGQDPIRCLVTLGKGGLNVAHAVRRASKLHDVSPAAVHDS